MIKRIAIWSALAATALLSGVCLAGSSGTTSNASVTGVVGLTPVMEHTCLAAYVPLTQDQALAGVTWYNNDGTLAFPRILLAPGNAGGPTALAEATTAASGAVGVSSGSGEVTFDEPVTSQSGGVYVIFEFPAFHEQTGIGDGGGPGIGYRSGEVGLTGWLSANGEDWVRMHPNFRLAVVPVFVDAQQGMKAMGTAKSQLATPQVQKTALLAARPNPFNPMTKLEFTLRQAGPVSLAIYNVRGELVDRLVDRAYEAGTHAAEWRGLDARGQASPSGIYFAQMKADGVVMTQRLTLVR